MRGTENNDIFRNDAGGDEAPRIRTETNHHGGILGGRQGDSDPLKRGIGEGSRKYM